MKKTYYGFKRRVYIDMDGTLCQWHSEKSLEEISRKGYFANLEPIESVVDGIKMLVEESKKEDADFEVYILSSVFMDGHSTEDKNEWLDKFLPEIKEENRIFVPYGKEKSTHLIETGFCAYDTDVLLDDFSKNLKEWHGIGVKLLNGINNSHGSWRGFMVNGNSNGTVIYKTMKGLLAVA